MILLNILYHLEGKKSKLRTRECFYWRQYGRLVCINRWTDRKKWYTHPIEYYSAIKNKFISFEGKLVELAIIMLNDITLFLKDNYWMYSPIWKQYANKIRCKSRRETIWDMKGNQQEGGRRARDNRSDNIPKYITCIYENIIVKTLFCKINMNHFLKKKQKAFFLYGGKIFLCTSFPFLVISLYFKNSKQ